MLFAVPGLHSVQKEDPVAWAYLPDPHSTHVFDWAPVLVLYIPESHFSQTDTPPVLYRPAAHCRHTEADEAPLKEPAAQGVHTAEALDEL